MTPAHAAAHALLAAALLSSWACTKNEPPGELVGAYHVQGELLDNGCGKDALPAMDQLSFDVELRQDDAGRGIWVQKMPPAHFGKLDDQGRFRFEMENSYPLDLSKAAAAQDGQLTYDPEQLVDPEYYDRLDRQSMQTCALVVTERISGTILRDARQGLRESADAGAAMKDVDLDANNEIAIHAAAGSHCEAVLSTFGGPFTALPCAAHYDLTGMLAQ